MRSNSGFTLMELIVTLAVVSTLSSIAGPSFLRLIDDHRLSGAAVDLLVTFQQARTLAAREQANVVLTFDPDNDGLVDGRYLVFVDNGSGSKTLWSREADERVVREGRLPKGVRITDVSFAGGVPRTRFNCMGFPNGLGGHVYLSNLRRKHLGLHLNLNGNPRLVKSASGEKGTWE